METLRSESLSLVVRDAGSGEWLRFAEARSVIVARDPGEVMPALERADDALLAGRWVAGWVAYEAAPGFDPALRVRDDGAFPLVLVGVFDPPRIVPPPDPPADNTAIAVGRMRPTVGADGYADALRSIRESIRAGDTYQVNYTYRLRGPLRGEPWDLFRALLHAQAATYAAWVDAGRWAVASASPELFFRRDGERVTSRPMKGTAPRDRPGAADRRRLENLLASRKERAENLMIVDMVRNDLSRIAEPSSVSVPELFVPEAYPTVWQLTSVVTARSVAPLSELFAALFPAASITGAPKSSTAALIARLEDSPRRIYTGSIGFAAPDGTAQFNVAIRTALVDRRTGRIEYGVGGGIVWDSDTERERRESRTKARILNHDPAAYRLLETLRWSPDQGYALLDDHVARLAASGRTLGFAVDPGRVLAALSTASRAFDRRPVRVRLTVGRDGEPVVEASALGRSRRFERPRLAIAPAAVPSVDPFLRHKTTRRDVYDRMLALCPGADDVLLWNERGEMTESCFSNVFLERDGNLLTPHARCGLLPGTLRERLLADGRAVEAVIRPDDLVTGRLRLGNSVRGLYEPESVDDLRTGRTLEV